MDKYILVSKKIFLLHLLAIALFSNSLAQKKDSIKTESIYKVHHKIEIGISVVGLLTVPRLYGINDENASLSESDVLNLSPSDVNRFDRPVLDFSEKGYLKAQNISDNLMTGTILAAGLLFLDKEIRQDWIGILAMYGEAHLAGTLLHQGSVFSIRRARPLAYNKNLPMSERTGSNTNNSFYSGHTSSTAVSSFFIAKVFSDYHNLNTWQKIGVYTAATIPSVTMGYYRMKAGKHFRTDILMGLMMGAATGILVPEFHKRKKNNLTALPVYHKGIMGAALSLKL